MFMFVIWSPDFDFRSRFSNINLVSIKIKTIGSQTTRWAPNCFTITVKLLFSYPKVFHPFLPFLCIGEDL